MTPEQIAGAFSSALKAQTYKIDIRPLKLTDDKFEMTIQFRKWFTSFERLMQPFDKRSPEDKTAILLTSIGEEAAARYDTASDAAVSGGDAYKKAKAKLELLFTVPNEEAEARMRFHFIPPESADEKPLVLIARLRKASYLCNFTNPDQEIMTVLLSCCPDSRWQDKRFQANWDVTKLSDAEAYARNLEQADLLKKKIKNAYGNYKVNRVITSSGPCKNCGRAHAPAAFCAAKYATCHFCKKLGHFSTVCNSRKTQEGRGGYRGHGRGRFQPRGGYRGRGRGRGRGSFTGRGRGGRGRRGYRGYKNGSVRQVREEGQDGQVSSSSSSSQNVPAIAYQQQGSTHHTDSFSESLRNLRI